MGGFGDWLSGMPGFDLIGDFLGIGQSSARHQNEINREREDTAMQRRMKDLKEAGINPALAFESNGAGAGTAGAGGQGSNFLTEMTNSAKGIKAKKLANQNAKIQIQGGLLANEARQLNNTRLSLQNQELREANDAKRINREYRKKQITKK